MQIANRTLRRRAGGVGFRALAKARRGRISRDGGRNSGAFPNPDEFGAEGNGRAHAMRAI
jgi:hypothetical protein